MKLPTLFKTKDRVVLLLDRDKADFYVPVKKTKTAPLLGSLVFKTTEVEFGEVINKAELAKEISNFFKTKRLQNPRVYLVLGTQLVFKGKPKEIEQLVPLKEQDKVVWQKEATAKESYVYNKTYVEAVTQAVNSVNGKIVSKYLRSEITQPDFAKALFKL